MIRKTGLAASALIALAQPAFAASGPFISLHNTNFVVLLAFIVFIGILVYFKVPSVAGKMLDQRAAGIRKELQEARDTREEAQSLLASYERKQQEVQAQAERIIEKARDDAQRAASQAKEDIAASIERRLTSATEQLDSARKAAEKEVRDTAIVAAVEAARNVLAQSMTAQDANARIDASIDEINAKLH